MYWNTVISSGYTLLSLININMRCIEITIHNYIEHDTNMININMRCIEIRNTAAYLILTSGLTLTWDVLKCMAYTWDATFMVRLTLTWDVLKSWQMAHYDILQAININMRCIEMLHWPPRITLRHAININMRCIEIRLWIFYKCLQQD